MTQPNSATFDVRTDRKLSVTDITADVEKKVPQSYTGTVTVFVEHTTAAVTINESESRLRADFETMLSALIDDDGWQHDQLDGNADSHLRAFLLGPSETIPVTDGTLSLGRWQSVLFVDCDGPRTRTVTVYW